MSEYLRLACAVPAVRVGDVVKNTEEICRFIGQADDRGCDVVLFPELSLTGYTCQDLFYQETLLEAVKKGLQKIADCTKHHPGVTAIVGAPVVLDDLTFNCAAVLSGGYLRGLVPKTYIPDYNEFYEKRWFSSALNLKSREFTAGQLGLKGAYTVPAGRDLLFAVGDALLGAELCEDLWAPVPPSTFLALNGAQIVVNLCASNEIVGKRANRRDLAVHQSLACKCAYAVCSAGATESTQDLVFSGHSVIAEGGTVTAENQNAIDSDYLLPCDIDLAKIHAMRRKNKTFSDAVIAFSEVPRQVICSTAALRGDGSLQKIEKSPFLPEDPEECRKLCMEVFHMQVAGLKQRLSLLGANAVLGLSGGLDSTLALLVCTETMRQLGRPMTDVYTVTMPCFGTSDRTYQNAMQLMDILGVSKKEVSIADAVTGHFRDIGHDIHVHDGTYENAQARERTQVLMDYASIVKGLVVGTGDLSELALGWCTFNGDHMSMYAVNCTVPKTMIGPMILTIAELPQYQAAKAILKDIVDTPISPELLPPDAEGKISQQTEDIVGPYKLHDFFLYYAVGFGFTPKKIYRIACNAFQDEFDRETIKKWLKNFYRRFFTQQFKRSCVPDGVKTGVIGLSPRGDLRMPSDASARIWLDEAESL